MNIPHKQPSNPPEIVYVSFSAEVSPHTTESLLAVMSNCANQGVKTVYLLLSTPGGSVMNGLNIYNVLIGMPFELITHNVGNVDSIDNAIFLAGSKRYACPHSTFMFHGVGFDVQGQMRLAQTKDATFAASTGIVHEVKDVQIPPGSHVISLVFQR
jgi:ATP-dependent protease ClpP protease subunit